MIAGHQIYSDSKENVKTLLSRNTKLNSVGTHKIESRKNFKDSTNVNKAKNSNSENGLDSNLFLLSSNEKCMKKESKPASQEQCLFGSTNDWSDIEEMHIYEELDDDYEDIMPKSERIQKSEIDYLFNTYPIRNLTELTVDQLPKMELLPFEDSIGMFSLSPVKDGDLYDVTPDKFIPFPDDPFIDAT